MRLNWKALVRDLSLAVGESVQPRVENGRLPDFEDRLGLYPMGYTMQK
jgi:hypothetical protein